MPAGRPTIYGPAVIHKAKAYIDSCIQVEERVDDYEDDFIPDDIEEELEPQGHGGALKRRHKVETVVKLPSKGGLARVLHVSRDTLYEWSKQYPEFSDIMELLGAVQEEFLINHGLSGRYNPTISKVLLTKHGYREGVDTTTNDKELPTPILGASFESPTLPLGTKLLAPMAQIIEQPQHVPDNNSSPQDSGTQEANPSDSGGDISLKNDLDSLTADQQSPERQDSDTH